MMQSSKTVDISGIHGTFVVEQELHHGHRANSSGSVQRQLSSLIFHASCGSVGDEFSRRFEIVFGGGEM